MDNMLTGNEFTGMLSAYTLPKPSFRGELTRVGRGTPMGELLRRYWHPVGLIKDASSIPKQVKILGEQLILFRDGNGRPGLLYPRCAHRGASLLFGKTEARGIRCCYHGWLFDVVGQCLEQPCERNRGLRTSASIQQPGYPVKEQYGLIFTYMGPSASQPLLPRYSILETMGAGEFIEADDSSIGSGGPAIVPCNWLQHFENVVDPYHVPILHGNFSGNQFIPEMAIMPTVKFTRTEHGIRTVSTRELPNGNLHHRVTEAIIPTVRAVANPRAESVGRCSLIGWVLPIDDGSYRIYSAGRVRVHGELIGIRSRFSGKLWHDMTEEEHRAMPGDYEAQVSQGEITFHSEEHLVSSDKGIGLLRRLFEEQLSALAAGTTVIGARFEGESPLVEVDAGTEVTAAADR